MTELNYLMTDPKTEYRTGIVPLAARPAVFDFYWHEALVHLHLLPKSWEDSARVKKAAPGHGASFRERAFARLLSEKIVRYAKEMPESGVPLWIAPELEAFFPGFQQPLPLPGLASYILHEQPFREILVLLMDDSPQNGKEWWQTCFLEESFQDLNGLYIVRTGVCADREEDGGFFDRLYEQTGLPACFTQRLPDTDGRKTAVVELRAGKRPPVQRLSPASLYLDLTSEREKRRILAEKRKDISYISARNYLDTAFKARYNAI